MFLSEFLKTSFQNVRSSHRTKVLHKAVLNELLNSNPELAELNWQYEYQLPEDGFGGTFDIDIVGIDNNNKIKVAVLVKAINSNVNKNIKNYANTTIGEAARVYYAPNQDIEKVLFVSVLPRIAPRFDTNGNVVGLDNVLTAKSRTKVDNVLQAQYKGAVKTIDLFFDIDGIKTLANKEEFDVINISNLDSFVIC